MLSTLILAAQLILGSPTTDVEALCEELVMECETDSECEYANDTCNS